MQLDNLIAFFKRLLYYINEVWNMKKNILLCFCLLLPLTSCNNPFNDKDYCVVDSYDDINHNTFYNELFLMV